MMRNQIVVSSRMAMRNAGFAARRTPILARPSSARFASQSAKSAVESVKSDAPWAITSFVVFGGMFVYITSPPSGGADAHDSHAHSKTDSQGKALKSKVPEPDYDQTYKVHRDSSASVPSGDQHLADRSLSDEDGANKQRVNKDNPQPQRRDNITFQHGVAASKEGHKDPGNRDAMISDPKKVVAAARADRQDKNAKDKGLQPSEDDESGDDKDE